jgi:hypothetical protein
MTAWTIHGQSIVVAAAHREAGAPPVLMLQGGIWRIEIDQQEAERVAAFLAAWWPRQPGR